MTGKDDFVAVEASSFNRIQQAFKARAVGAANQPGMSCHCEAFGDASLLPCKSILVQSSFSFTARHRPYSLIPEFALENYPFLTP
jgi:hypothetical protein